MAVVCKHRARLVTDASPSLERHGDTLSVGVASAGEFVIAATFAKKLVIGVVGFRFASPTTVHWLTLVFVALVGAVVRPAEKKLCTRFLFETVSSLVSVFGVGFTPFPSLKNRPSTGTLLAGVLFLKRSFGAGLFVAFFVLAWLWVLVSLSVMFDVRIWSVEWTKGSPWKRVLQRKDGFPMRYFEFSGLAYGLGLRVWFRVTNKCFVPRRPQFSFPLFVWSAYRSGAIRR